jgi:hypothetical protein
MGTFDEKNQSCKISRYCIFKQIVIQDRLDSNAEYVYTLTQ